MSQYATLKAAIEAVIHENGNNEITGDILQQTLVAMVNSLGAGFQFMGFATPSTNPGTPDQNVLYLAVAKGTYANFDGSELDGATIAAFKWNGAWEKQTLGGFLRSLGSLPACDLNTLVTNGTWLLTGENYTNWPGSTKYGFLRVTRLGTIVLQEAYEYTGDRVYKRRFGYTGTNIESWVEIGRNATMRGALPSGDLNAVVNTGTWLIADNRTYQHVPNDATRGFLRVSEVVAADWILQEFFDFSGGGFYKRKFRVSDTPGAWEQISGGGEIINNYYTYNVTATPTITTDTNQYLSASGDTTDRTLDILTMLQETGVCRLGPGTFYVDGVEMPDDTLLIGSGNSTRIRLIEGENKFAVKMGRRCTIQDIYFRGGDSTPTFGATSGTRYAIMWQGDYTTSQSGSAQPQLGMISNCRFVYFSGSAILCSNTGPGTYNHIEAVNCTMRFCWAGINVSYYSEYHKFTNIRTSACYYGAINNGGNNVFVNCDFSSCTEAFLIDNSTGQSPNNSHGSCIGCLFNHTNNNAGVGIRILGAAHGFVFSGCQIFYSKTIIDDSDGIVFSACNYGNSNCDISVNGGGAVLFIGNMYKAAPPITITNNSHVVFANCYVSSTGAVVSN